MSERPDVPIRDAATMILLRRQRHSCSVLMGMRGANAAFMPSKYVFPGGAVDAADAEAPLGRSLSETDHRRLLARPRDGAAVDPHAIAAAALRELAEETGLIIGSDNGPPSNWPGYAETGISPDASALRYVFRAITPPGRPRRFDARFFVADASQLHGDPDDFGRACDELSHLHWVALDDARALDLPFITEVVLAEVSQITKAVAHDAPLPMPETVPFFDNQNKSRFAQII